MKSLLSGISVAALLASPAFAEEAPTDIVVTATRAPTAIIKTGQSLSVLDAADIREKQALSLPDILVTTPSVTLSQNGGTGTAATLRVRGAEGDHTLYVLDGIRLSDPTQIGGGLNAGLLLTGDIDRIEIVRGPLSTLWGSRAIGATVSLTTRQATRPFEADAALEGAEDAASVRAGIGGKADKLNWRLFAAHLNDSHLSAYKDGSETDKFEQNHLRLSLDYAVNDAHTLKLRAARTRSHNDYDGYLPDYSFGDTKDYGNTLESLYSLAYQYSGEAVTGTLSLSQTDSERHDYDSTDYETLNGKGKVTTLDYTGTYRLSDTLRLVYGATAERSEIDYSSYGGPLLSRDADLNSVFVQGAFDLTPAFTLTASVRYDDHSRFGGQTIGHLSMSYRTGNLVFRGSVGQGFKAPSLYQLYSDYGNDALKAEKADNGEIGLDWFATPEHRLSLTAFTRKTENQIDFASCFGSMHPLCATRPYGFYDNIAETEAKGIEADYEGRLTASTVLRANYSHIDAKDSLTGAKLPRRPRDLANIDLVQTLTPALTVGLGVRYAGATTESAYSSYRLKAYTVADLRADWAVTDRVSLYGRIENLTDTDYETAAQYSTPTRRLWLGVRATY